MKVLGLALTLLVAGLSLMACPPVDSGILSLTASVDNLTLDVAENSAAVTLSAVDAAGATITVAAADADWSSSASGVASVYDGVVTGVAGGTATITVSYGGRSDTIAVTVNAPLVPGVDVFVDNYATDVDFAPFGGSNNSISIDSTQMHGGTASLKVTFDGSGYTGGALVAAAPVDVSAYNALTFWAKASVTMQINGVGLGNAADGNTAMAVERGSGDLTTGWQKYVIPLPDQAKATALTGLFHFAEGGAAVTFWLDDIRYENVASGLAFTSAAMASSSPNVAVGSTGSVTGCAAVYQIGADAVTLTLGGGWYDYTSDDTGVATVAAGTITGVAEGTCNVTAELGGVAVGGTVSVTVFTPVDPTTAPPAPTLDAADVVSLLSQGVYTDASISSWGTVWDDATVEDFAVAGATLKKVTFTGWGLGIEGFQVDVTGKTTLHIDYWSHTGAKFGAKVVDFGPNAAYDGGDDANTGDMDGGAITTDGWASVEFDVSGLASVEHISQLLLLAMGGAAGTVYYIGNIYFY